MAVENDLLFEVEAYVTNFITEQVTKEYAYHDIQHTINVVGAVKELVEHFELAEKEQEILILSAWFHDTGYDKGSIDHEERGCRYATDYLSKVNYPPDQLQKIHDCIMATKVPQQPQSLLEEIMCDADLNHLGKKVYWDRCSRLRQEFNVTRKILMSEHEWVDFELDFISNHYYHTDVAKKLYGNRKEKHIRQLKKQKLRLNPNQEVLTVDEIAKIDKEKKSKKKTKKKSNQKGVANIDNDSDLDLKQLRLGRGVETMYRTTYRTHVNLSSIADNKANIMLSINAIIVSITVSTLVPNFDSNPKLIIPTIILLVVCLVAIIFATFSTMPKITEGKFTREDIEKKRSNLLFFGNFYNMDMDDFHWGMMEMIKDSDFLYSSMTRDLYYLGIVLAKKYRYLRVCYSVFMYGLIVAVLAFAIAFLM